MCVGDFTAAVTSESDSESFLLLSVVHCVLACGIAFVVFLLCSLSICDSVLNKYKYQSKDVLTLAYTAGEQEVRPQPKALAIYRFCH